MPENRNGNRSGDAEDDNVDSHANENLPYVSSAAKQSPTVCSGLISSGSGAAFQRVVGDLSSVIPPAFSLSFAYDLAFPQEKPSPHYFSYTYGDSGDVPLMFGFFRSITPIEAEVLRSAVADECETLEKQAFYIYTLDESKLSIDTTMRMRLCLKDVARKVDLRGSENELPEADRLLILLSDFLREAQKMTGEDGSQAGKDGDRVENQPPEKNVKRNCPDDGQVFHREETAFQRTLLTERSGSKNLL